MGPEAGAKVQSQGLTPVARVRFAVRARIRVRVRARVQVGVGVEPDACY